MRCIFLKRDAVWFKSAQIFGLIRDEIVLKRINQVVQDEKMQTVLFVICAAHLNPHLFWHVLILFIALWIQARLFWLIKLEQYGIILYGLSLPMG